jgi:2-desacetyl-2-hydroxyethyl bacteriochlorophyllide A dehydrogenase
MRTPTVVFPAPDRVAIEELEEHDPGPGQVLVRTTISVISIGTELTVLTRAGWAKHVPFPFLPGYSMAGEVLAVGPGVTDFTVGDRVCGGGHHTQYEVREARDLNHIPATVADEAAAFRTLGQITLNGVRQGQLVFGEAVVIIGMGLVGQMATQWARFAGALPVIAVDLSPRRLDIASEIGPLVAIQGDCDGALATIRTATRGRLADVVIEATGVADVIPGATRLARNQGRIVLLGSPRGSTTIDLHDSVHARGLHLIGAHNNTHPPVATLGNPWTRERDGELFLDLLAAGRADVQALITHRYPWQQAPAAYALLQEHPGDALGVVLDWR